MDADRCRQTLAACLPALVVRDLRFLAEGWDSAVFLVNGDLLFRFPKRTEVGVTLERELRLLPALAATLPVAVPRFLYAVRGCAASPHPFAGYRRIEGAPADEAGLDAEQKLRLAAAVGGFLRVLHAFPLDRAAAAGAEPASVAGGPAQLGRFVAAVHEQVAPLLSSGQAARLAAWFESAERRGLLRFTPVLVHGDLGAEHLIVDPLSGTLNGVIDWGDAGTGDPAIDFAGLLGGFGEAAAEWALAAYDRPRDTTLIDRARMYVEISPLHEVIYGRLIRDDEHIERGLVRLRRGLLAS